MESEQKIKKRNSDSRKEIKHIGIAADHGGFELKVQLRAALKKSL